MSVAASRGEKGWVKIGTADLHAISATPDVDPALMVPPATGNFYQLNYTTGLIAPSISVRANVHSDFFTAALFGAWFTLRDTNEDMVTVGTVGYYDGNSANGLAPAYGNSFMLEWMQGGMVDLMMTFVSTGTTTMGTTGATPGTALLAKWSNCAFGTATGVVRASLSYTNNCYPSGELSSTDYPAAIHGGPPSFTLVLDQKAKGTAPTTSETITITPPGGSAVALAMKFRQVSPPAETIAYGETIIRRVFSAMRIAPGDTVFAIT
jgi:hypothetical protein